MAYKVYIYLKSFRKPLIVILENKEQFDTVYARLNINDEAEAVIKLGTLIFLKSDFKLMYAEPYKIK